MSRTKAPVSDVPENVQQALDKLEAEEREQALDLYQRYVALQGSDDLADAEAAQDLRLELQREFDVHVGDPEGEAAMAAAVEQLTGGDAAAETEDDGDDPEGEAETAAASAEGEDADDLVVTFRAADGTEFSGTLAELEAIATEQQNEELSTWLVENHPASDDEELELREEANGQQAIPSESTVHLSTRVDGPQPLRGVVRIKGIKMQYFEDLNPGDSIAVVSHVEIGEVTTGGEERIHHAEAVQSVELRTDDNLAPRDAVQAVLDLQTKDRTRRACIDQCASKLIEILEEQAPESPEDTAFKLRAWAYDRFDVADGDPEEDARLATWGVPDEPAEDGEDQPASRADDDAEWDAAAPVVEDELPEAKATDEPGDDEPAEANDARSRA